jgi:hypothetical protein
LKHLIKAICLLGLTFALLSGSPVNALERGQLDRSVFFQIKPRSSHGLLANAQRAATHNAAQTLNAAAASAGAGATGGFLGDRPSGVDTVPTFANYFYNSGSNSSGRPQYTWEYTFVGRSPFRHDDDHERHEDHEQREGHEGYNGHEGHDRITRINAPIIPVTLDLRDENGAPRFVDGQRMISSAAAFVAPTVSSPIFQAVQFSSSARPTQFIDALYRAEFHGVDNGWRTLLTPSVKRERVMTLNPGSYFFVANPDGSCCLAVFVEIHAFTDAFMPKTAGDSTSIVGQAEVSGDITNHDISTFLFPNTLLYDGSLRNCCYVGFHDFDRQPGDRANGFRERRFLVNFVSWLSPDVSPAFQDIVSLSHEFAETFHDPFGENPTPWWQGPNGVCGSTLEVADVLEALPTPYKIINLHGMNYHVQNMALLQWFAGVTPSTAINGAYSFPDDVLTTASTPQAPNCEAPAAPLAAKQPNALTATAGR